MELKSHMADSGGNWKLKLRYGKLTTPYTHYTILADVLVGDNLEEFECIPGKAWLGVKIWASSEDEAIEIIKNIGESTGFKLRGKIEF